MGMVVRTNTMALNAYRQLGMNNSAVAKSLEKLSSGYRINRAGDDAAGLAISEKMKAQITGLETASANAQDGISLIQTAEGNLSEVHDMLNRMVELATKSANGTYTITERNALQDEVDALLEEIDRISQSANFNGTNLLDGTMGLNQEAFTIGDATDPKAGAKVSLDSALAAATAGDTKFHTNTAGSAQQGAHFTIDLADFQLDMTGATGDATVTMSVAGVNWTATLASAAFTALVTAGDLASAFVPATAANTPDTSASYTTIDGAFYQVEADGSKLTFTYAGAAANQGNATADDAITDAMLAINDKLGHEVTLTAAGVTGKDTGDSYHGVLSVQKAQKEVVGQRAGIELDLTKAADLFKDGAQLTIDGTTFSFKLDASKKDSEYTGTVIDLSGVKGTGGADPVATGYAKAAAALLSNETTDHFEISDGGNGKIKVDQTVADYDGGNNAIYTSRDKLTALFSAVGATTKGTIDLTVKDASKLSAGDSIRVGDKTYTFGDGAGQVKLGEKGADAVTNLKTALENDGFTVTATGGKLTIAGSGDDAPAIIGGGLTLQIGDTADSFNKMTVAVANMSTKGLGLDGLQITSENLASKAIDKIKTAINTVSSTRAGMGALQNRLEHTINNLDVAAENLSAANSRIRDTDMAKEMMNYTKMNVLVQSAQAMLAQANQQPQSVLQLLQ